MRLRCRSVAFGFERHEFHEFFSMERVVFSFLESKRRLLKYLFWSIQDVVLTGTD